MKCRICAVTATRAEFGLLVPLLNRLRDAQWCDLTLLVTGTHLSRDHGSTFREIENEGFSDYRRLDIIDAADTGAAAARSAGRAAIGFSDFLEMEPQDLCILLGDRYELLGFASAAYLCRTPIAHLYGGEITQGALDDAVRHAVTKLSRLHFTSTACNRARVISMGEDSRDVYNVGALGVDNALAGPFVSAQDVRAELGLPVEVDHVVMTFHPETMRPDSGLPFLDDLLAAISKTPGFSVIVTGVNADPGSLAVRARLETWAQANPDRVRLVESLGRLRYLSAVKGAVAVVGNSSSGIVEAPTLRVPVLDVGGRQAGRERASCVCQVAGGADDVAQGLLHVLSNEAHQAALVCENPYGDGHAASRIEKILHDRTMEGVSVEKRFIDHAVLTDEVKE